MNIKIGTAPDAWGVWFPDDPKQIPAIRFLDEIVEAGFEWIELGPYGYLPINLSKLRSELDQRGLKVCACVVEGNLEEPSAWPGVEKQVLGGGELAAGLDGRFMVLIDEGYVDLMTDKPNGPTRLDEDARSRLIDTTQKIAQMARDRFALKVAFHPNAETHVESEDQIETLLEQTDPDLVSLCLDLGHHAYRGGDPVAFIRRHHQRILHIHFKNVEGQVLKKIEAKKIPLGKAVGMGVFCGLAEGQVDYEAVWDVLREVDYNGFGIVEQDMYPVPFDKPLPIAKRSRAYLRQIGIG